MTVTQALPGRPAVAWARAARQAPLTQTHCGRDPHRQVGEWLLVAQAESHGAGRELELDLESPSHLAQALRRAWASLPGGSARH